MFFNMFGLAQPLSGLIGYALPAYFSMQALESPGATDDQQWLTYWTVFSTLTVLESVFLRVFMRASSSLPPLPPSRPALALQCALR